MRGATTDAPPLAPAEPAIDRAHLARMTHGERDLEREVLQLFATQADRPAWPHADEASPAAVGALAHTLSGSARGIGAWQVADAAAAVEADAAARPRHRGVGRAAGGGDRARSAASHDRPDADRAIN